MKKSILLTLISITLLTNLNAQNYLLGEDESVMVIQGSYSSR